MSLTIKHLEQLQEILQEQQLDYQLELEDGKIIVIGPSDVYSSELGIRLSWLLMNWVAPRRLGRIFDSSGGFILPNTDLKAPDVSFVSAERLRQSPRYFAELVPDLVVKINSQSDRIKPLQEKIQLFLALGAQVGLLIDPEQLTVSVYRPNVEQVVLSNTETLKIPELLPGWEIPVAEIWPPVFE